MDMEVHETATGVVTHEHSALGGASPHANCHAQNTAPHTTHSTQHYTSQTQVAAANTLFFLLNSLSS
jgi:hypothetical protein